MATALHVKTDGTIHEVDASGLDDYQRLVGGMIEYVNGDQHVSAYVNEEGRLMRLPENLRATRMLCKLRGERGPDWLAWNGVLRGDVVFIGPPDDEGNTTDLNQHFVMGALAA